MEAFSVADAKAHLSPILDRVVAGERVTVTRRGRPVATIAPIEADERRPSIDWEAIDRFRQTLPMSKTSAAELVRRMRGEDD